jgi:hypothetical protein
MGSAGGLVCWNLSLQEAEENKTVPSEEITKEAKAAEPDAAEQNEEVSRCAIL